MNTKKVLFFIVSFILIAKSAGDNESAQTQSDEDEPIYSNHKYFDDDSISSLQKYEPGRVQIKVYRGPDVFENGESYAAHGFWVKQPSEDY